MTITLDSTQLYILQKAIQWRKNGIKNRLSTTPDSSSMMYASEIYVLNDIEKLFVSDLAN